MNDKQTLPKHDESVDPITTAQTYPPAGISVDTDLTGDKDIPEITSQSNDSSTGSMNSGLARALVGGLIGATLGTLAGAMANKRTAKGANYAAKGVSDGVKTVAEGVNHAAIGVGSAVKSVAKGINYAVVGGLVDVVKDTALEAKQSVSGALDAVKGAAEDVKLSDNQTKLDERLVVIKKQITPDEVNLAHSETQTAYISAPVDKEPVNETTASVDVGTPIVAGDVDLDVDGSLPKE